MRAVIDEGVPRRTVQMLRDLGHDVSGLPAAWKGLKNGQLLRQIRDAGFEILIICDRNMHLQQNITRSGLALIVLPAQRFEDLAPFVADISDALHEAAAGEARIVRRVRRKR